MTVNTAVDSRLGQLERDRLETLLSLSHAFNSTVELDKLLPRILARTLEVTEAEAGAIWLVEKERVRCAATAGPAAAPLEGTTLRIGEGAVGVALGGSATLVVPDALEDERFAAYRRAVPGFSVRSALVIPLRANDGPLGAIELVNDVGGKDHFDQDDIAFLEALADDAGAALRNAELFEAERRAHHFQNELNLFGQLFVVVIVMLAVGIGLGSMMSPDIPPILEVGYSWAAMLIFLMPILAFSRRNHIPLSEFGIRSHRWKRWAFEGALLSIPLILLMPLAKRFLFGDPGPLITFARYEGYPTSLMAFDLLFYLPHTFLQELAARGLIQGSLQRFMADSHRLIPVLVTSSLFGVGHLYAGFAFAFLTLAMSLILGMLYLRQGSLVGVTLTHALCGHAALAFGLF